MKHWKTNKTTFTKKGVLNNVRVGRQNIFFLQLWYSAKMTITQEFMIQIALRPA